MARVLEAITQLEPVIFDGTPHNPHEQAVEDAVGLYKTNACDGVIAVGGGSSIDLASRGAAGDARRTA